MPAILRLTLKAGKSQMPSSEQNVHDQEKTGKVRRGLRSKLCLFEENGLPN
jgi:hypothetical protein